MNAFFFWNCHYKDIGRYQEIKNLFPSVERLDVKDLVYSPLPLTTDDYLLTTRFHPHMQAARIGAVGDFLAPINYSKFKQGSIVELGSTFGDFKRQHAIKNEFMAAVDSSRVAFKRQLWKFAMKS